MLHSSTKKEPQDKVEMREQEEEVEETEALVNSIKIKLLPKDI